MNNVQEHGLKSCNSDGNNATLTEITSENGDSENCNSCGNKDEILLFTTKTCPNCPTAKKHLTNAGVDYKVVDAEEEAGLSERYRIQSVPTLVVDGQAYNGVGPILAWIRNRKVNVG